MKNKRVVFILLPIVLIIWGAVIYRIYFAVKQKQILNVKTSMPRIKADLNTEEFVIVANYRDPFLVSEKNDKPKIVVPKSVAKSQPLNWPNIKYNGSIKNKISSKQLILLNINSKDRIMKIHQTTDGVMLNKVYKDSVEVLFEKEKKTIKK
jgi:hypothetical protein